MKGVVSVLAVAASVAPALALPGWNRGDNNIVNVINEIEHAHPNGGAWGPPQGQWGPPAGNGRRPPVVPGQHQSWAKPSAAASDVVVDPASGKSGSGTARPTGYTNVTSSAPYWNNASAPATSYITTYVTVTDVVSTYTSTYQHPVVSTSGSSTSSFNAVTTSTITTSYQSTITVTKTLSVKPAGPGGYGGSEPSTTPVNAVSTSSPAGGNGGPKGGNGSPVSNVIDSSSAVYITVPISQISHATTLAPIPWDGYTPSNYVGLPPKSSSPASPAGGNGVQTTVVVTDYVTTYTTVCPYEKTHTTGGQTSTSTGITTSTVTSSVHTTLTVTQISSLTDGITITPTAPVYGGSSSGSSPAGPVTTTVTSGYTTVSTVTSVYTTTKPITSTITSGSSTTTSTGSTTQISTTTVKSTITVSLTSTVTVTPISSSSSTSPVVSPVTNSGSSSSSVSSSPSSSASGSSSPISSATTSASTSSGLLQSSYTTYTTTCSENNTVTIHTHSEPLTSLSYTTSATLPPYGSNLTTTVGPTGSGSSSTSSTVSGPVSGSTSSASSSSSSGSSSTSSTVSSPVTTSESSFTTYTTTCTENGTTTLHTHSAPIYNSTTSTSPVVGPTGGSTTSSSTVSISASYSGNSTSTSPVIGPTGGSTASTSSPVTGPTSYDGNSTTSSVVGPTGGSTSVPESSYTTYTTTCTENGTTTLHTHSAPITNATTTIGSTSSTASGPASYSANSTTSSDPVGPTGGSTTSSSTASGPASYSGNSTTSVGPTAPLTTFAPSNETSFTTYTTLCTDNGTTTIHTHSAPIYNTTSTSVPVGPTGGSTTSSSTVSGPATYSGNSTTIVGPTAPVTTSSSESSFTTYTTTCTTNGTTEVHTHSAPITGNGTTSSTAGPTTTGGSSNIISYSTNSTSSFPTAPVTTSLNSTSSQPTAPITTSPRPSASASISSASNSTLSASKTSSSSTASTCKATPTATGKCIPCEGQPGSDPDNFCGYTINDNPYDVMPQTCVTREYNFELVNGTISPDGVPRLGLTVNGQFPGPQVTANWGDTITVHVKNSMANNGSTIHWHGIRQNYTNEMDGVASITQCPIAPGDTMTYTFRASNYGFSWYHAHISIQSYMGVFGPMVINGPKSVAGSFAEEVVVLNDWSHRTVNEMYDHAQDASDPSTRSNPTMDTGLINGLNVWGADGTANQTGKRWSAGVQAGETKLFRILNSAIQSTFVFSLDGHQMQVIAADFVPITPYTANTVVINPGQRYDVLITFNQAPANYWFRADIQQDCGANLQWNNIKGIITYSNVQAGLPTSSAWGYSPGCSEELMSNLKPAFAMNAGVTSGQPLVENVVPGANGQNLIKWSLDGVTFQSEWGHPTLESIVHNGTVPPYSGPLAVSVPNLGEWVYVVIESPIPAPHPIHLHGHDFYVLAQGFGTFSSSTALNLVNPPRRDTVLMPGLRGQAGYVVIAFLTDNPGAWLMHCHIGWHNAMGFALQIIEAQDLINATMTNTCAMDDTCKKYNEYATEFNIVTNDSGV